MRKLCVLGMARTLLLLETKVDRDRGRRWCWIYQIIKGLTVPSKVFRFYTVDNEEPLKNFWTKEQYEKICGPGHLF